MIKIPVIKEFESKEVIGELSVDETKLPAIPNYHFGLGYKFTDEGLQLICVAVVPDDKFCKYEYD